MKPFADIHCHPTLHPFAFYDSGRRRKNSLWWDNPPKERQRNDKFPEFSQMSMPALARGNVRLVVASLYPLEQPWFDPSLTGTGSITDFMARFLTVHVPVRYINAIQSPAFNYFEYLKKEYDFLLKEKDTLHSVNEKELEFRYIVAKDVAEINRYKDDDSVIIVIPSIEGAHSFVSGNSNDIVSNNFDFNRLTNNIIAVKNWDHPPLFVTLGHHFYNGLCGHSRTIPDGFSSFLIKQNIGLNEPLNKRGEEVIDCLLGLYEYEGSGHRILIDVKHMSVAARKQFYAKITELNYGKPDAGKIPIVASHCGYSGFHTLSDAILVPDTEPSKYKNSETFNPWSNNLTDEDIVNIFDSRGIIGINLDQRILSGMDVTEDSKDFSKHEIFNNDEAVVEFWTRQIAENILGMVKAVVTCEHVEEEEKVKAWDIISLGSDFDGMINPVDSFIVADEFKDLRRALEKYMPQMDDYELCSMGLTVNEILDKIMYDNAVDFVVRNYKRF